MPSKTWVHGGAPLTTLNAVFSGTTAPANWLAAINAWVATANENGDSGTVLCASAPTNVGIFVDLQNDGSIPPAAVLTTMQMQFDYAVTNGPMAGGVASSAFNTSVDGSDQGIEGPGAHTGTINETNNIVTVMGSNVPADLFTNGPFGLIYAPTNTGVFAAHNRRVAISNFSITVAYTSGTVVSLSPALGPSTGNTLVTIIGTGLTGATQVTFGGTAGTSVTVLSDTKLTVLTPAHVAGAVDVTVVGVGTLTSAFTYTTLTRMTPDTGPVAGGTTVTFTGFGFTAATGVTFDGIAAAFTIVSNTTLTAVSPSHGAGAVTVVVAGTDVSGTFTYALVTRKLPPLPRLT